MADVTFDGYVIRGDKSVLSNRHEFVMGMWFGDYMTKDLVIRQADIQGVRTGIIDPYFGGSQQLIEDSYLRNSTNIAVRTLGRPAAAPSASEREPKSLIIRNVRFGSTAGWNLGGLDASNIAMSYTTHDGPANLIESDTVFVYDYNGVARAEFQVYYNEQRPDFVVPQSGGNLVGSPVAGLTNQQNWNQYGIAIAGAVAPANATTASWTNGLVRTIGTSPDTTAPTISGVGASGRHGHGSHDRLDDERSVRHAGRVRPDDQLRQQHDAQYGPGHQPLGQPQRPGGQYALSLPRQIARRGRQPADLERLHVHHGRRARYDGAYDQRRRLHRASLPPARRSPGRPMKRRTPRSSTA